MGITKTAIICIAFSLLACAQALKDKKSKSPLEIKDFESGTNSGSPFSNVPESSDKHSEGMAQPEVVAEIEEEPTKIEETKEIYIDENGIEVNYDKNLYYCENCSEEEEDDNNDNKKLIFSTSDEELLESIDNDSYETGDGQDLEDLPLYDDVDAIDELIGYEEEFQYDDDDDDLIEYDIPLLLDELSADDMSEGSGF
ncbi:hypothetical protein FF38_03427 [Lucilia cuprina]|uniref:Uncharacterized protein n=1 Tax=Lucilia cuprina TaxID=7375 RepID=A0A0L0C6L1_LUCCU|nr:hypothetical protein CVS40_10780 [Lucilia cuprina]KNC27871.1 hypothetical protein FF38_03427 [Lucilia cuprina]